VSTARRNCVVPKELLFKYLVRYGKTITTFAAAAGEHLLTAGVGHPGTKTVFPDSALVVGLVRPFHELCLIGMKLVRERVRKIAGPNGQRTVV
jgi:hypothetical protein